MHHNTWSDCVHYFIFDKLPQFLGDLILRHYLRPLFFYDSKWRKEEVRLDMPVHSNSVSRFYSKIRCYRPLIIQLDACCNHFNAGLICTAGRLEKGGGSLYFWVADYVTWLWTTWPNLKGLGCNKECRRGSLFNLIKNKIQKTSFLRPKNLQCRLLNANLSRGQHFFIELSTFDGIVIIYYHISLRPLASLRSFNLLFP